MIPVGSRGSKLEAPAFIDVESGLYRSILRGLLPSVRAQLAGLQAATSRGDWARAHAETAHLNFGPAARDLVGRLEFYAGASALLGAALFAGGDPEATAFAKRGALPPEARSAARLAAAALDGSQNEWFRVDLQHALMVLEEKATVVKAALGSFGAGQLAGPLNAAVDAGVRLQASVAANLLTSRMVAFGALSQARALGQETWQWSASLDAKTCRACRALHGRVFATEPHVERLRTIISSRDADTARSLSPWPKQTLASIAELEEMDDEGVAARGHSLPPAHPLCRCHPVPVGTVPVRGQLPRERKLVAVGDGAPGSPARPDVDLDADAPAPQVPLRPASEMISDPSAPFDSPSLQEFAHEEQHVYRTLQTTGSSGDLKTVEHYRNLGYESMNKALRAAKTEADMDALDPVLLEHIDGLTDFVNRSSLRQEVVAYRGVSLTDDMRSVLGDLSVGSEFVEPGFSSWSLNRHVAMSFADGGPVDSAMFRVRVPEGSRAIYMGNTDEFEEFELLLQRGARYRIVAIEERVRVGPATYRNVYTVELV